MSAEKQALVELGHAFALAQALTRRGLLVFSSPMRLTSEQQRSIRQSVREADPAAAVYLFGSRVDDSRRGGDIDLLVLSQRIGLRERLRLLMRLEDRLGAQRIDLVVKPALDDPFARMASAEGVRL